MEFLSSVFLKTAGARAVVDCVSKGRLPIEANGLSDIFKALLVAAVFKETKRKIILITPDEAAATVMSEDLKSLGVKAALLPARDFAVAGIVGQSKEYEHKRIDTLSKLLDGAFDVVLASAEAAAEFTIPSEVLRENTFTLEQGETVLLSELLEKLVLAGYTRVQQVDGTGQFSLRGGILDVFGINQQNPARIEFWGDEIDTISYFEIDSQRRTETTKFLKISPANEVLCDREALKEKLLELAEDKKLTEKQKNCVYRDIEALQTGLCFSFDRYVNLLYPNSTVFDYFENPLIITAEYKNVKEKATAHDLATNEDIKLFLEEGTVNQKTAKFHLTEEELTRLCEKGILLDNFVPSSLSFGLKEMISFEAKRNSAWSGDISVLKDDIGYMLSKGGTAVIAAGNEKSAKLLSEDLNASGISTIYLEKLKGLPARGVVVTVGGMSSGFELPELNFSFITHKLIYSEKTKSRRKTSKNAIGSLEELKHGDYVVHASHGIGIFEGINRITNSGITKDYIKIKYAKGDVLYVPVTQLDLVSKYIGTAEDGNIRLNRLGGQEWQKTRRRVRAAVKDMAKQLTELYAKRMAIKGHAFSPDTDLQNDFERRFEYEETEDQLRCINEIKNDMERSSPMDRLLCGDVGFGKTEVALRAAFKCISEGKQCAILVPTTILAWQHYNTIIKRFGEMPVEVKLLSRFVTPKEQAKTILGLKRGNVDLVVGTHRLISKDVTFKDLGLVIIDEEQRFGVAQKEKLKEAYPTVDVLTLSATPIPRTLNMAMSGLRDLSSIDEAPNDRHPVQTYVLEQHNGLLLEAIRKELRRGGQVYYLHNRVDTINRVALKLSEQLPDCRVAVSRWVSRRD
ncbi:MAG: DEAD/DEAH box helicase [Clostridia bacterium]|nr:DEAD/DEAH box helicase [Clostridia bacterium]